MQMFNPPHPGQILREYINGTGITVTDIAQGLQISRKNLSMILNEHAGISAEMAWKLSAAFSTTPEFWINFQKNYDLWQARQKVDMSRIRNFLESAA